MAKSLMYKQTLVQLCWIVASIAITRFTQGLWLGIMTLAGIVWALSGRPGKALSMYLMILSMVVLNPIIMPMGGLFGILVRFGPLLIGIALMLKGISLGGQSRVPLGMLISYLFVAIISSMNGWAPMVSYLKIANFIVFILGLWFGLHTLVHDPEGVGYLRATILAYSVFLIFGSLLLLPFPAISTLSGFEVAMREGNLEAANVALMSAEGGVSLFCGITRQSQALAVLSGVALSWVLADMLFVEQRFDKLHLVLIGIGVLLTYLSRSRAGLLSLFIGVVTVAMHLPKKMRLSANISRRLRVGITAFLVFGFVAGVASELTSSGLSRWLRKVEHVEEDTRSLSEAVTSSRQGLIESSIHDFRRNPMFGSGFQVAEYTADQVAQAGSSLIISAPIEKGVLPIMILGETGIVGAMFFAVFLFSFCSACSRRRLYVTAALFMVLLATNMGEATFFSPGGVGGVIWSISIIGGYCIDMKLLNERVPGVQGWR